MNHEAEHPSPRSYLVVLILLLVLLALTVGAAFLHIPSHNWGILIAMTIAIAKGLLIILYFMHVKFGAKQTVAFATAGFLWLGILLTLTMADYITRNHPADLNYKGEPRYLLQDVNRR